MKLALIRFLGLHFWTILILLISGLFIYRQFNPITPANPTSYELAVSSHTRESVATAVGASMAYAQFCPFELNIVALVQYHGIKGISVDAYDENGRYRREWERGQIEVLDKRIRGISTDTLCSEAIARFGTLGRDLPELITR